MSAQEIYGDLQLDRFKQKKLIARWIGDELLLYEEETSTAHCLNGIAGEMWIACQRESSAIEVAEFLRPRWPDIEKKVVWASMSHMAAAGLLEETTDQEDISMSRRKLIRKLGITAAAVLPIVVTSVLIPPPAAAASCAGLGKPCSATKPCCPGLGLGCVAGICIVI
jgi:hypothetical protein